MSAPAAFLRDISSSLRSGCTLHRALAEAAVRTEEPVRTAFVSVTARLGLGASLDDALAGARTEHGARDAADALRTAHRIGGDVPRMLDELAAEIEEREHSQRVADAHTAGIRISARIVAALPLFFLPLSPPNLHRLADPLGLVLFATGLGLALAGMCWIERLAPRPCGTALGRRLAALVAAGVAGGSSPHRILDVCARDDPELKAAARRVRLGLAWPVSLARASDPSLRGLGRALELSAERGLPVAQVLRAYIAAYDARRASDLEAEVRRAPVKMIVPLSVCLLPAFAILGAGPFVRGLLG